MAVAGLASLGIRLGYAAESTKGTKPTAFTGLTRINTVGGITVDPEAIDASALEDPITRNIKGRAETGGSWPVTVNITNDTIAEWTTLIATYKALTDGKRMWFELYHPELEKAFFVIAQPPEQIPMPESSQNGLWTVDINLTIEEYKGLDEKVAVSGE